MASVGLGIFVFFPVSRSNSQSVSQRGSVGVQVSPAIRARRSGVNEEVLATQTTSALRSGNRGIVAVSQQIRPESGLSITMPGGNSAAAPCKGR
jgi:hypothetical protein